MLTRRQVRFAILGLSVGTLLGVSFAGYDGANTRPECQETLRECVEDPALHLCKDSVHLKRCDADIPECKCRDVATRPPSCVCRRP